MSNDRFHISTENTVQILQFALPSMMDIIEVDNLIEAVLKQLEANGKARWIVDLSPPITWAVPCSACSLTYAKKFARPVGFWFSAACHRRSPAYSRPAAWHLSPSPNPAPMPWRWSRDIRISESKYSSTAPAASTFHRAFRSPPTCARSISSAIPSLPFRCPRNIAAATHSVAHPKYSSPACCTRTVPGL